MRTVDLMFPALAVRLLFTVVEGVSCNKETAMSKAAVESNNRLANGVWGGEHIRLEVTDRGATIEYDCAHSTIDEPIFLNSKGNFDVKGKYTPEHGGPIGREE